MDDAEVGPHIIFPLASPLILLRLFICLPQSISSRTPPFPPLVSYAVKFYLSEPFCFLRDVLCRKFLPRGADTRWAGFLYFPVCLFKRVVFIDAMVGHLEHYSNAKTENHIDLHMWSHCAAVYDFLNYFKLILRHRYYHKTPLTQMCDNFKGHTGFKSVRCLAGLQNGSRHINAFYLMYSLQESAGAAARRRKVNRASIRSQLVMVNKRRLRNVEIR